MKYIYFFKLVLFILFKNKVMKNQLDFDFQHSNVCIKLIFQLFFLRFLSILFVVQAIRKYVYFFNLVLNELHKIDIVELNSKIFFYDSNIS